MVRFFFSIIRCPQENLCNQTHEYFSCLFLTAFNCLFSQLGQKASAPALGLFLGRNLQSRCIMRDWGGWPRNVAQVVGRGGDPGAGTAALAPHAGCSLL